MTLRDKLELGLKEHAAYRRDNFPPDQVRVPPIPTGPGRPPEIPLSRRPDRAPIADGGRAPSPRAYDLVTDERTSDTYGTAARQRVVAALREFVGALDRRVAHVERLGEVRIAREAAVLRQQAMTRIEELVTTLTTDDAREAEAADATMTDDGSPLRKA